LLNKTNHLQPDRRRCFYLAIPFISKIRRPRTMVFPAQIACTEPANAARSICSEAATGVRLACVPHSAFEGWFEAFRTLCKPSCDELKPDQIASGWRAISALLVAALVFQETIAERSATARAARRDVIEGGVGRINPLQPRSARHMLSAPCT
jgi:hypothetical protein